MADTIATSNELKVELAFADGDTRTFRLKNPIDATKSQWQQQLSELNTLILNKQLLIGDKAAGLFTGIYRATTVARQRVTMDIS